MYITLHRRFPQDSSAVALTNPLPAAVRHVLLPPRRLFVGSQNIWSINSIISSNRGLLSTGCFRSGGIAMASAWLHARR